ncbi:MAG: DUF6132 family protein [Ignavibacteriaceae bacterium]|nr:DUF6132 family protein [Ignavibacteriaceae bacterium]
MKYKSLIKRTLPILIGGIAGYAYYHFIGCRSGSCPISGNPYISTSYGAIVGLIITIPSKRNSKS